MAPFHFFLGGEMKIIGVIPEDRVLERKCLTCSGVFGG